MQRALILGATGRIGDAISGILRAHGTSVKRLSRVDGLDWRDPIQAEATLARAAEAGPYDLIFDATGALTIDGHHPEKTVRAIDAEALAAHFWVNAIGPALLIKHARALVPREGRAVIATLSARVGSIGDNRLGGWISYRAAKAALNQIVSTAAIELARTRPDAVVVALHPGTVATSLSAPFAGRREVFSSDQAAERLLSVIDGLTPKDTGCFFAHDGTTIPW